jgi:predicted dehydrogenase
MFAVFGSGFGLYGYLPALVEGCAQRIVMSDRYHARYCERPELKRFASHVKWVESDDSVLDCADGVVLALRPVSQSEWIPRCLVRSKLEHMILEKPLAHSPEVAIGVFDALIDSRKVFRIGYTFRYMPWAKQILHSLGSTRKNGLLSIHWSFFAHHYRYDLHNWKRFNAMGGGAIRFYGIHIIALLAEVGFRDVSVSRAIGSSQNETEKWIAVFTGKDLPECEIQVDTRSKVSKFQAEFRSGSNSGMVKTVFANLIDPFALQIETSKLGQLDRRVPILTQLCQTLWNDCGNEHEWYAATLNLWLNVEKKTQFERVQRN